ncbi:MAG: shikimate kinase [Clostridiales Family XIII bacterium]|jgi:shikimate kinase|nr:shikimate kinase [Clostridiales Family XIII bacterium]
MTDWTKNRALKSVVLIGMPGSGKTHVGREAARICQMDFTDMDELIEQRAGRTIPEIFETDGEEGFRKLETELAAALAKKTDANVIIASEEKESESGWGKPTIYSTGGGVVTRPENEALLKQIGPVIFIHRDIAELASSVEYGADRPLLVEPGRVQILWEQRRGAYRGWADAMILNEGSVRVTAQRLAKLIKEM